VVGGWLAGVDEGAGDGEPAWEVEWGGALEDGALGAGVEELGAPVEVVVVEPALPTLVVERVAVGVPVVAVPAARAVVVAIAG
jgi:hypothetical protein